MKDTFAIRIAQFFVRNIWGCKEPNTYLICGIIKTNKPLETESTHIIRAEEIEILQTMNVENHSRGNNLDGIMQSPIWRIKI